MNHQIIFSVRTLQSKLVKTRLCLVRLFNNYSENLINVRYPAERYYMGYRIFTSNRCLERRYGSFAATKSANNMSSSVPTNYMITTPIYYLNAAPHIGHLFTTVLADVVSRWYEMRGTTVRFSTGSDEHGLKVQQAASSRSKDVESFCNEMSGEFKKLFDQGDVNFTRFIRTTESSHKMAVKSLWEKIYERGFIYKGTYEGWYCTSDEAFLTDDQVMDTTNGATVKVSKESGHPVEWTKEENYLFRLSHFVKPLSEWLDKQVIVPDNFEPIVRQFIAQGLPDLSVSRSRVRIPWGIPVPGDDSQTIYVWLDALANYLTVGGYPDDAYLWPADCHVIGKDILRFHAIYWPAFLMSAGLEPPRKIVCHSHWLMNKEKMSKSRGNIVDPFDRINRYTSDGLRYYLMKDGVPHSDGNYSDERAIECINTDLVNTLCNLVSRCAAKSINPIQVFPRFDPEVFRTLSVESEKDIFGDLYKLRDVVDGNYRNFAVNRALDAVMSCLYRANSFVQTHRPWELVKSADPVDRAAVLCTIHVALESARVAAVALHPVTPRLSRRILGRLGCASDDINWDAMSGSRDKIDRPLGRDNGPLFSRIK